MAVDKPRRIIMHWSAGGHTANSSDIRHYHEIVEGDGTRVRGEKLPEANNSTADGNYAAHVAGFNTGSIGLSMAGMAGARERPFKKGSAAITPVQLDVFVSMVAEYAKIYKIPIDREHVLCHAEVGLTYPDRPQAGKWDITWLPGMSKPGKPIVVGDTLRDMITERQSEIYSDNTVVAEVQSEETEFALALAKIIDAYMEARAT